jgi:hypothetical protein
MSRKDGILSFAPTDTGGEVAPIAAGQRAIMPTKVDPPRALSIPILAGFVSSKNTILKIKLICSPVVRGVILMRWPLIPVLNVLALWGSGVYWSLMVWMLADIDGRRASD